MVAQLSIDWLDSKNLIVQAAVASMMILWYASQKRNTSIDRRGAIKNNTKTRNQVRGLPGSTFPNMDGPHDLTWRQNVDLSGNNVMMMGIYYECLQRQALLQPSVCSCYLPLATASRTLVCRKQYL